MVKVVLEIKGLNKVLRGLENAPVVLKEEGDRAIRKSILLVEGASKPRTPIDTGRLRSSYITQFRPLQGALKVTANYAIYVHEGTRFFKGRPFLQEGVSASERAINQIFGDFGKKLGQVIMGK